MTYRDEDPELTRRERLLEERRAASREGDEARVLAIDDEVAIIDESRKDALRKRLPMVARARIASPCPEPWDGMIGDHAVRSCARCDKEVFDLSVLTVAAAEALLWSRVGKETCARMFVRADGTMLFADCTVGVRGVRARQATLAVGAAIVAAAALTIASQPAASCMRTDGPLEAEVTETEFSAFGGLMMSFHDQRQRVVSGTPSTFAPPLDGD